MNKHYKGGVLLTALLFVLLFSFLFTLVVEEARLTNHFSIRTKDFYSAKIIYSMFCIEINQEQQLLANTGMIEYSEGKLSYRLEDEYLFIDITVNQKKYQFKKKYTANKKDEKR
ncbi:competence type IV pilus minor pilin ComGG [Enterococcus rivorum]|uniref:Competence protein ComGG n=1 Tax=Enterococcus rivorum TaxID=762845 RepID=A0A1E5KZF1_9ENTE|nr:competence type IV pilus minor pilin ComGG [Enterococcus rivorum]MBP2099420.1 hypothetical protein [Enterococcus rivorum]OEH83194.1 hypothetical protein BCR26_11000 [Enterococcus rivorum]